MPGTSKDADPRPSAAGGTNEEGRRSSLPRATATMTLPSMQGALGSSAEGLTSDQAERRLKDAGANRLSAPASHWMETLRGVASPLVLILLAASLASAVLGELTNAAVIAAMVVCSAAVDLVQSTRSARTLRGLQAQITPTAMALRDGNWLTIPREAVVEGDVVRLSAGDVVPADSRLIASTHLHVQQAALTGESLPVEKESLEGEIASLDPSSPALVFAGTSVISGTGTALVYATGPRTSFGDIAARLTTRPEETEFERGSRQFGLLILQAVLFLVLFVLVVNITLGRPALASLLFAVALAVGMTPEYLPMITTATLAQGAARMAREKVLVKHLASIQNLGSVDVLCSDKTGTITQGTMSLEGAVDASGEPSPLALRLARLNSAFQMGIRSSLDAAILDGVERTKGEFRTWEKVGELPFDFERRRLSVLLAAKVSSSAASIRAGSDEPSLLITKGAPEGVLSCCSQVRVSGAALTLTPALVAQVHLRMLSLGNEGKRVLAVASRNLPRDAVLERELETELIFEGLLSFSDPLVDGVAEVLDRLAEDGVEVKVLSGDEPAVVATLCHQAGLDGSHVVTGPEIDTLDEVALARVVEHGRLFARVTPAQKHRIVLALQHRGHVVGFLGDGINDAPALHAADVGISVAGAVDVAQDAADILLLEKRLDVLHTGILAGRRSFANVLKYLRMGSSSNFGNMLSMAGSVFFLPFLPMLPTQILVNNFLYDLAQLTIPTDKVDPAQLRTPQRWNLRLLQRYMVFLGPVSSLFDFLTFATLRMVFHFDQSRFQTAWFVESLLTQVLVLLVIRTEGRPWVQRPSWPLLGSVIAVTLFAIALPWTVLAAPLGMRPLPLSFHLFLAGVVPAYLVLVEWVKRRILRAKGGKRQALLARARV